MAWSVAHPSQSALTLTLLLCCTLSGCAKPELPIACVDGTVTEGLCACPTGTEFFNGACVTPDCVGVVCNDGIECTTDSCDARECTTAPASDGASCNGGVGGCMAGVCVPSACADGTVVDGMCVCPAGTELFNGACVTPDCVGVVCNDGIECTTDSCDTGKCTTAPASDGASCNGGVDSCTAGMCSPRAWGEATSIETDTGGNARRPQVAIDANGNVIALWQQTGDSGYDIWANRYTPNDGWGMAKIINTGDVRDAPSHQVVVDDNGNAIAVWEQSGGGLTGIWANRFTPNDGWGVAKRIETDNVDGALGPHVAINANGIAVVVWFQSNGMGYDIWANRFTPNDDWGTAVPIETNTGEARDPNVAIDSNGNAIVVWELDLSNGEDSHYDIWANRFTGADGWGDAVPLETHGVSSFSPQVAFEPGGNAIAVWQQSDNGIWANRFTPIAGWGMAEPFETGGASSIAVDGAGNTTVVWHELKESPQSGRSTEIWANRYDAANAAWNVAERIGTSSGWIDVRCEVAADDNGNAIAVWEEWDGTAMDIWARRYTTTAGWGVAEPIESDARSGRAPRVAVNANGNAIAVWEFWDIALPTSITAKLFE